MRALLPLLLHNQHPSFLQSAQSEMREWWKLMEERGTSTHTPMCPQVVSWHLPDLLSPDAEHEMLRRLGLELEQPPVGCCGQLVQSIALGGAPMAVRRAVANIATENAASAKAFYGDVLGMAVAMDLGWIVTFMADAQQCGR